MVTRDRSGDADDAGAGDPDTADLEPLLSRLAQDGPVAERVDFPVGTLLPDGRLDLCKQDLGPDGGRAVAAALRPDGPVRHLLMGTDLLGDAGAVAVAHAASGAGVDTVYLGCNLIGPEGAHGIAAALRDRPGVSGLWLKRNPLGVAGARTVAALVRDGTPLTTADLVQTGLTAADLPGLVDALTAPARGPGRHRVERLFLTGNRLGPEAGPVLARLLGDPCGLRELYVSATALGDAGVRALGTGLARAGRTAPGRLRRLAVGDNGAGPEAVAALVAAAVDAGVEVLSVGGVRASGFLGAVPNRLDEAATARIAGVLAGREHALTYLDLHGTGVTSRGALALEAGQERAATGTHFVLGSGIARAVKRRLSARGLPAAPAVPNEVRAIRSVYRTP
ncbi:ribonuclease inhibitor [Streptomycetaceae bacterium NBC_01309]